MTCSDMLRLQDFHNVYGVSYYNGANAFSVSILECLYTVEYSILIVLSLRLSCEGVTAHRDETLLLLPWYQKSLCD